MEPKRPQRAMRSRYMPYTLRVQQGLWTMSPFRSHVVLTELMLSVRLQKKQYCDPIFPICQIPQTELKIMLVIIQACTAKAFVLRLLRLSPSCRATGLRLWKRFGNKEGAIVKHPCMRYVRSFLNAARAYIVVDHSSSMKSVPAPGRPACSLRTTRGRVAAFAFCWAVRPPEVL